MTDYDDPCSLPFHLLPGIAHSELLLPSNQMEFDQVDYFGAITTDFHGNPQVQTGKKVQVGVKPVKTRGELDTMILDLFLAAAKHSGRYRIVEGFEGRGLDNPIFASSYLAQDTFLFTTAHAVHVGRLVWTGTNYYGAVILNPALVGVLHDKDQGKRIHEQMEKLRKDRA